MKTVTFYIADDGAQFSSQFECVQYENIIQENTRKKKLKEHHGQNRYQLRIFG